MVVLRWLGVVPAGCAAGVAATVAVFLVEFVTRLGEALDFMGLRVPTVPQWWFYLAHAAAMPFAFVYAGASVAPKYKLGTAIVLTILMTIYVVPTTLVPAALVLADSLPDSEQRGSITFVYSPFVYLLGGGVSLASCVAACLRVRENEDLERATT